MQKKANSFRINFYGGKSSWFFYFLIYYLFSSIRLAMTTPNDLDAHVPKALEDYRDVILLEFEVVALTGYKQPDRQLAELRKQGFYRARQNPVTRRVILERAHYQAVCAEVFNNQVHRLPPRKQNENKRLTPKNT